MRWILPLRDHLTQRAHRVRTGHERHGRARIDQAISGTPLHLEDGQALPALLAVDAVGERGRGRLWKPIGCARLYKGADDSVTTCPAPELQP
jgi:hypothetical protein